MQNNKTFVWGLIGTLVIGGAVGYYMAKANADVETPSAEKSDEESNESNTDPQKQIVLYTSMRKLWADHVWWTREYLVAALNNAQNANAAATRLLKNQEDIGAAIAAYYGGDAGNKVTTLLKEHISIATEIVSAAKASDETKLEDAKKRWETNGDQIATALSELNPNWPKATLSDMMSMHLTTTAEELSAIQEKKYNNSVSSFEEVISHINTMADALSEGIVKQFPQKF